MALTITFRKRHGLRTSRVFAALLAAATLLFWPLPAGAQDQRLAAGGNGTDTWIALPEGNKFTLLVRDLTEPPFHFHDLMQLQGRLAPDGMAVGSEKTYLIYENLQVQSVQAFRDINAPQMLLAKSYFEAVLPAPARLISVAAAKAGPW